MSPEPDLHFFCRPTGPRPAPLPVEFVPVHEFLADEPACKQLWELVSTQFRTRGKFLAVWSGVRYVGVHRDRAGEADGFLLVNAPVNWQIDYVVVRPDARGRGVAAALVAEALNQAHRLGVPYVMLTSKPALRPLYEACGFTVVEEGAKPAHRNGRA
jgi:GNAT superfamily N-acetyltransferase